MRLMETGRPTVIHELVRTDDILELEGLHAELGAAERPERGSAERLLGKTGTCAFGRLTAEDVQILIAGGPL